MADPLIQIIQDYQENQRRYHQNFQQLIDLLENRYPEVPRPRRQASRTTTRSSQDNLIYNILRYYGIGSNRQQDYEDVVVRPTRNQIDQATELILYDNSIIHSQCSITLEPFEEGEEICRIRQCSHCFKKTAIMDWFRRNVRCPVCRYDIRDYRVEQNIPVIEEPEVDEQPSINTNNRYTSRTSPLLNTIQSSIRSLLSSMPIQNELETGDQLVYTFDIPLYFDPSGNFR